MKLTRRGLIGSALAAPALLTGVARAARTTAAAPAEQVPGYYRFRLGEFKVTVLSDGNLVVPTSTIGVNQPGDEVVAFLTQHNLSTERNYSHTNHILIDTGQAKVLVDVGSGDRFQPSAGRLIANMEAAGIDPAEITHCILTHAHPDHVWGMMDDFGDEPRLPEAEYAISETEFDWWMGKDRIDQVPEMMQAFVVGAQNALTPVAEKTAMVRDGAEVVPGVTMVSTPGHTVGHMSVMVESAGQRMLVTGDAISHVYASFAHPGWHFGFDTDKEQAVATRKRLLEMAMLEDFMLAGYHLPFPGIGHVVPDGDAYRFLPALWRWGDG